MNTNNFFMMEIPQHNDARGKMCVIENMNQVPFNVQRLFYDFDNEPGTDVRGNHANRNSQFAFICLHGSCKVHVDDGANQADFVLNSPSKMLIIKNMVWKEMSDYSRDSVLLVLSDCKYDCNEYIRKYSDFLNIVKKGV